MDSVAQDCLSDCFCCFVFDHCCIVFQEKGKEDPLFKVCIDLLHVEKFSGFFFNMKNTILNS